MARELDLRERGNSSRWPIPILVIVTLFLTILGGVGPATRNAAAASTPTAFDCSPGYVYSMQANGNISQIDPNGNVTTFYTAGTGTSGTSMNGLGIGSGGTSAYWYERSSDASGISTRLNFSNGTVSAAASSGYTPSTGGALVAGAVDLATGNFLFGKFDTNGYFHLYAWTGSTYEALGQLSTSSNGSNGDMAFDASGNLFVVGSASGSVTIIEVNAADITAAISNPGEGNSIASKKVSPSTPISVSGAVNGIAFDATGVYLGTGTTLYKFDPTTWAQIGSTAVTSSLGSSTDLASCSSPSTLTVKKNLPSGRYASSDQFTLSISKGSTSATSVTTTGTATGVQEDAAGPAPVVVGNTYTVAETAGNSSTSLSNYASSLACVDTANGDAAVTSTNGQVTIPTGQANSPAVVCTFTNTPNFPSATVTISKQVADVNGQNAKPASGWTVGASLSDPPSGVTVSAAGTQLTGSDGSAPNPWTITGFSSITETTAVKVSEVQQSGYTFLSGSCTTKNSSGSTTTTLSSESGIVSGVGPGDSVSCTFVNKPIAAATVTISKQVADVNGKNPKPASNWTMDAALANSSSGVTIDPTGSQLTGSNGSVPSPWSIAFPTAGSSTDVTVSETQQSGYVFVSGSCTTTHSDSSTTVTTLSSVSGTVSGVEPGDAVACSFTNRPAAGSVSWSKVDAAQTSSLLSGSVWKLTGPSFPAGTTVTDCTASPCTGLDQDPAAGKFDVTGLEIGAYTLQETSAPVGFTVDKTTHQFSITSDGQAVVLSPIEDTRSSVPALPLTGGASADAFLLGGGGLLTAAGVTGWLRRRRSIGKLSD